MSIVIVRNNIIENIGSPPLEGDPPEGTTAHEFDGFASIGWLWNGGNPEDPNPPPEAEPIPEKTPAEKLAASTGLTVAELKTLIAGK